MDEGERRRGDRKERGEGRETVEEGSRSIERMNESRVENYIQSYKGLLNLVLRRYAQPDTAGCREEV